MRHPADRLTPADRALWRRVAATVRPLAGTIAPEPEPVASPPAPANPPPTGRREMRNEAEPAKGSARISTYTPPPHPEDATLDGVWDRRMRGGRVRPDMVIDLHGHSLEAAHAIVEHRLQDAAALGQRLILIVTGKGSRGPLDRRGVIRESLADWLQLSRLRPFIAAMRPAHPRHGGGGAFYVVLRRAVIADRRKP